ncbi:putative RNA methylase family domain-containing protein [Ditylenchus destructor]|uniref:tRNA (guanine(10)-N(2))-methyltransferase TRMT11 n=1 Tax=Ditylenchus destructor TaxID=166010 RepID=A0AAD4N3N7_9BILA|nr:putative RNA methylase family domain-containing protein [Ditylenchus destructor]
MVKTKILLCFSQVHVDFRKAEIDSICTLLNLKLDENLVISQNIHYYVAEFDDIDVVLKILQRSMLLKKAYEVIVTGPTHDDVCRYIAANQDILERFNLPESSWALKFQSFGKQRDGNYISDMLKKLASVIELEKAPICLKNPTNQLNIIEDNTNPSSPCVHFCLYANLAGCSTTSLVLDPFSGTGGLIIAAAHFGSYTIGTEINYQVARAIGKSARTTETRLSESQSVLANFCQYNLENKYLGTLIADSSRHELWRIAENSVGLFDAIVADPPYGVREKGRKLGNKTTTGQIEFDIRNDNKIYTAEGGLRYPEKAKYGASLYLDLLELSFKLLRSGGRSAFWFPVIRSEYSDDVLPRHDGMRLLHNCEQILTRDSSRRLLVYEKVDPSNSSRDLKAYFRKNCYETKTFRDKVFKDV